MLERFFASLKSRVGNGRSVSNKTKRTRMDIRVTSGGRVSVNPETYLKTRRAQQAIAAINRALKNL